MEEELTGEQLENSKVPKQLQAHVYKKGQSGNPSGRPEGISMKEYLKKKFRTMTDEEREEYLDGVVKLDLLKMAEGNPETKTDVTSGGEKIVFMPQELLDKHKLPTGETKPI
jgi:hypothetical protein